MGMQHLKVFKLLHTRSQQNIHDLHAHISNMQHGINENNRRFADCFRHQIETEHRRYQELLSMRQYFRNAQVPSNKVKKLKDRLKKLQTQKEAAVKELNNLADNLDEHFSRIKKAKIAESAVAIGGTVLVVLGLGVIPFSFGTSTILSIAGCVVSGAGGITAGGSSVVESVPSSTRRKSAQKILDDYNSNIKEIRCECLEIGEILSKNSNNMETEFRPWCTFWNKLVLGASSITHISWNTIANPILNSLKLASVGEDVAAAGLRGASVAERAFTIVGGGVGILLMPLDIYI
ncbi:apolipoprotein L [Mytilus galloprovincialis]|uniref:Apolipoprotein L n=1 Tax=Mytilus galloprovincialis TaxID=29158 RepID=A0A8B6D208_MYTGA|nr:apolipoprotein L [Mytilus galloprovincialis]